MVDIDASAPVADTVRFPSVEIHGGCDVEVGKLGPKSSSPLLLVASLSGGCGGRSSKLAGGRLGPIERVFLADDAADAGRESSDLEEGESASLSSSLVSRFRFPACAAGKTGPTEGMAAVRRTCVSPRLNDNQ